MGFYNKWIGNKDQSPSAMMKIKRWTLGKQLLGREKFILGFAQAWENTNEVAVDNPAVKDASRVRNHQKPNSEMKLNCREQFILGFACTWERIVPGSKETTKGRVMGTHHQRVDEKASQGPYAADVRTATWDI